MAIWENELQEVLENVLRMHRLFKTYKIKSLLVDEDRTIYKNLLVQVSGLYQCKSYVNCHGEPYAKIGSIPLAADYIFVWGKSQKTLLANWGISNDRILISGNTKYEKYLYTPALKIKKKICQEQKLLSIKPLLLIIPYHIHEKSYVWENSLWLENKKNIETVSMFSETNVIVKLHPGDTYETETKLFTENLPNKLIRVLKYYDSLLLAKGADLLIVSQSTFCIDGLAYQKPVILVDQYSFERYKSLNFFYDGTTQEKLNDALQGILTGRYQKHIENWKTAADYILDAMDGKASGKIARILAQQQ
jgi:UDP-N-acetylglucosamine 2-epimerase